MRNTGAREKMLAGATDLFRRRGVAGTALADIVEHANAPRGSLYHYFPGGKDQLAKEATTAAGRFVTSSMSSALAAMPPHEGLGVIIDIFRQGLQESDYTVGCPVAAGALEGGAAPGARDAAGEAFTAMESVLSAALWQHGVAAERADRLATMAVAAVEGALILAKSQRSTRALDRVGEELAELLTPAGT